MGGMVKGKSDPYAKISVGETAFRSNVVKENLNPVWNEMYEVCMKDCTSWYDPSMISNKDDSDNIFMFTASFMFPQVVLRPQSGQEVNVELFDKDMDKDDFLGRWESTVEVSRLFFLPGLLTLLVSKAFDSIKIFFI